MIETEATEKIGSHYKAHRAKTASTTSCDVEVKIPNRGSARSIPIGTGRSRRYLARPGKSGQHLGGRLELSCRYPTVSVVVHRYVLGMEPLETTGDFWSPDNPAKRVPGILTREPGSRARLTLKTRVIDELAAPLEVTGTGASITHSGDPGRIVADGVPRVLLGDTSEGPVTCVDSYLQHPPTNGFDVAAMFQQVWDPYTLIVGAHLPTGRAATLDAVRFIIDSPGWWTQLPDAGSATSAAGKVVCERGDDKLMWLEFRPSFTLRLRSADRAVRSVMTLMKLAVDVDLTPLCIQVRETAQGDWLDVKTRNQDPSKTSWPDHHNLLPPSSVTLERIAEWLAIEQTMDGLAAAAANPVEKEAIQVQGVVACSLIEGIHKRIVDAREMHYVKRARALHETALRIDPEITKPVDKWPELVKEARNDLAHHNTGRPFEEQVYNWMIAESSVIWVLRLCLLSHAGFTDQEIAEALSDHQRYKFYRENLKMHVKERSDEQAALSTGAL
ncbi:HEPN domain-containing protein [Gordonia sp. OPL2]|uniref:ApeA N-terminal domain 1-containing protein n=1 Tax=Gordonia sp. OPL2 TaxID=2486274 RepID=UPI001656792C|nr:HEPN domain-containing protein [Gordonia sp. OPL2]